MEQAKETVAAVKETVSTFQQDLAGIKNLAHYYDLAVSPGKC